MSREIEFTEDFATKKKGDKFTCDNALANTLVKQDKVAKYTDEKLQSALEKADKEEQAAEKSRQKKIKDAKAKIAKEESKRLAANAKAEADKEKGEKALIEKYGKK